MALAIALTLRDTNPPEAVERLTLSRAALTGAGKERVTKCHLARSDEAH